MIQNIFIAKRISSQRKEEGFVRTIRIKSQSQKSKIDKKQYKLMLRNIQPEVYHRKAKSQLQDIRHNLKLLNRITQQLDSMDQQVYSPERQVTLDKSEKLKLNIRDKLKSMGVNINEMISILDHKINILVKELNVLQKSNRTLKSPQVDKKIHSKTQEEFKYQINQLEERIFELQKKQNDYVKQISQLKEKNAKLRQQFSNLSFDSNQRIKELSEKLHNNTSPNLSIKRAVPNQNPQNSYLLNGEQIDRKKSKNNFVKIKGGNNFEQQLNPLVMSPGEGKRTQKLLESMTSESSQYDIKGLGYEVPYQEQNSMGNLKFGCFPAKQESSQKTKTGSTSENKKTNFEDKRDKSRRFEFLLNNLVQKKEPEAEGLIESSVSRSPLSYGKINDYYGQKGLQMGSYMKGASSYQPQAQASQQNRAIYQYKPMGLMGRQSSQIKNTIMNENMVKRYQI